MKLCSNKLCTCLYQIPVKKALPRPHNINSLVLRPNIPKIHEGGREAFFSFFIGIKTDEGGFFFFYLRKKFKLKIL